VCSEKSRQRKRRRRRVFCFARHSIARSGKPCKRPLPLERVIQRETRTTDPFFSIFLTEPPAPRLPTGFKLPSIEYRQAPISPQKSHKNRQRSNLAKDHRRTQNSHALPKHPTDSSCTQHGSLRSQDKGIKTTLKRIGLDATSSQPTLPRKPLRTGS